MAYTLRSCLPGRRWIAILIPCAASLLFGLIVRTLGGDPDEEFAHVAAEALFGLVLPVTCLVIGDAVLGAEVRRGAFTFTWMSPVPTWQIALGRWAGGAIVASACVAAAFALSAVVAGAADSVVPVALTGAMGATAYVAVFIAIGATVRRAAVWSLAFVFLVERLLGEALAGIAQLSPQWVARVSFVDFADGPSSLIRSGVPHGIPGIVRLVVIAAVALVIAARRLRQIQLSGSSD